MYTHICTYICIYMYIYMYIHIHIHIYVYIYTYIYMYIYSHVYICICICIYVCVYVYIYIYKCFSYIDIDIYTRIYPYIYVCTYVYVCVYTHTHTHTHAHIISHTHTSRCMIRVMCWCPALRSHANLPPVSHRTISLPLPLLCTHSSHSYLLTLSSRDVVAALEMEGAISSRALLVSECSSMLFSLPVFPSPPPWHCSGVCRAPGTRNMNFWLMKIQKLFSLYSHFVSDLTLHLVLLPRMLKFSFVFIFEIPGMSCLLDFEL